MIFGIGFGMINPPITNTAVLGMPPAQAGVAAAVASTSRQLGQTLGVAVVGAIAAGGAVSGRAGLRAGQPCGLVDRHRLRRRRLRARSDYRLFIKRSNAKSLGIADFFQQNARTTFLIPEIKDVGRDRALEDIVAQQHHDLFSRSEGLS